MRELIEAVENNNIDKLKEFINNKVDINYQTEKGDTALILASYYGNIEIVKLLIKAGANKDITDRWGFTAIDYAIDKNYKQIIKLLKNKN